MFMRVAGISGGAYALDAHIRKGPARDVTAATRYRTGATVIGLRWSSVGPVIHGAGWRGTRAEARDPLGSQLLDIRGPSLEVMDPLAEPRLERFFVASDGVPLAIEPVVPVVPALDVRRVSSERFDHHGIDDQAGDDRAVRIGPDHRLVDELLDDHDHPVGRERRLLLATDQPPDLGVASCVGPLGVD